MLISKSNVLNGLVPTVTTGNNSTQNAGDITDPDHSTSYLANGSTLIVEFGSVPSINYVAISGHNAASVSGGGVANLRLFDGTTQVQFAAVVRDNVVFFNFTQQSFTNLRVQIAAVGGTTQSGISVSFIAGGLAFTVPNGGETSGYARNYLTRPYKSRVSSDAAASPTAIVRQRQALKGTLTLPNMLDGFVAGEWQDFLDFTVNEPFFIKELEGRDESAYICFEPTYSAPTAHPDTRALHNAKIQFRAFNGL